MDQLNEYYNHIVSRINSRKPFKYNLQDQSLEIKNKYLPVDTDYLRLKQEADQEYPIILIIEFLKKRNALIDIRIVKCWMLFLAEKDMYWILVIWMENTIMG